MAKSRARKLADIIVSAGVDIDGNLTFDGGSTSADLTFADGDKANFGDASDLQIFHNGSHSFIKDAGTGDLYIGASNNLALMNSAFSENYLLATTDGAVTLYYDGSSKLATSSSGVSVTGHVSLGDSNILKLGTGSDLQLYHDGSNSSIQNSTGNLYLYGGGGTIYLKAVNSEDSIVISPNAGVSLYYDNSAKLATTSAGIDVTGSIDVTSSASYGVTANRGFKSTADIPNFTLVESDASGQTWQINSTGAKLSFRDISRQLDRIVIDTAGRVGVGTTSPAGLLEISADSDDGTAAPSFLITNASTTLNDGAVVGTIEFRNSDSSGTGPHVAKIQGIANASDERTTEIAFSTGSVATTTEQMRIDSSGNVGIGTNSPSIQVDVENTVANSGGKLRLGTSDSSTSGVMGRLIFGNGNDIAQSIIEGISDGATDASALIFKTEATGSSEAERMRIDSSGNLLVGKTSADDFSSAGAQIEAGGQITSSVASAPSLRLNRGGTDGDIIELNKAGTTVGSIANDSTSLVVTSASTGLKFGSAAIWPTTGGGVTNSNGAKDLGASTAKFKDAYFTGTVHAQGGVEVLGTSTMIKHDYNNLGSYVQEIRADDRRLTLSTKTNDSNAGIVFELYDAEKARFDYAGRLLIGQNSNTGSANADNLVVGTGSGNNGITILSGTTNGGTIAFADADADEDGFIAYNHPSQFMQFGTAAAEQMRITSAGRVGINESSPDALLHITGQSTAGLIVENGAGNASTQPYVSMAANNYSSGYGTFRWEDQRASQASPSFIWEVHDGSGSVLAYDFRTGATGASGSKLAITQDGSALFNSGSTALMASFNSNHSNGGYLRWMKSSAAEFYIGTSGTVGGGTSDYYDIYAIAGLGQRFWTGALERMRITPTGNVGIGTTSPGAPLHVYSDTEHQIKIESTASAGASMQLYSGGSYSYTVYQHPNANFRIGAYGGSSFIIRDQGNSADRLTIINNGNVGIGTTSPFAKLQVAGSEVFIHGGTTTTGPGIFLGDNNFANSNYYNSAPGIGAVGPYGGVTAGLAFYVYGSQANSRNEAMRIDNTGKVGVGTAVPNRSDFNIHGANRTLASTTSQVAITASDSIAANIGGSLHFGARYDTTTTDFAPTGYVAGRRENATVNNYAGYLQFGVTQGNAGTIEAMRITSTGNVGIGTADPKNQLHVNGGGYFTGFTNPNGSGVAGLELGFDGTQSVLQSYHRGTSSYKGINMNAAHVAFNIGGVEKARVHSNGNVGIGTSSPSAPLEIAGATNATDTGITIKNGSATRVRLFHNDNAGASFLTSYDVGAGQILHIRGGNNLTLSGGGGTEHMRITTSGNVGIGTSSPSRPLDVTRSVGSIIANFKNTAGTLSFITLGNTSSTADQIRVGANGTALTLSTNYAERMRIDSSGNVGINQSNPTRKLHVTSAGSGVVAVFGDSLANNTIEVTRTTTNASYIGLSATSAVGGIIAGPTFTFSTCNSGGGSVTERARIDSSGNLLVGTTSNYSVSNMTLEFNATSEFGLGLTDSDTGTATARMISFVKNGSLVGYINSTTGGTTYSTSSDQRLKDNIVDAPSASDDIDAIQVRSFDWKADGSHQKYGMVAQELQSVAPEAVTAPEDPEEMMGVDYSKLVPMLVKEIQSLRARVAELEGE